MLSVLIATLSTLRVDTYPNVALHGKPTTTSIASLDNVTLSAFAGSSAEISGRVHIAADSLFAFNCTFEGSQLVFVWLDDHLICNTDPPFTHAPKGNDGCPQNPLQLRKGDTPHVLVHVYSANLTSPASRDIAKIRVRWAMLAAPLAADATPTFGLIPSTALSPDSSALEMRRRTLQRGLASGWNLWGYNLLGVVRLPESLVLTVGLCQLSSGACLTESKIEDKHASIRVGPYATDASYLQFYVAFRGLNVSISASGGVSSPLHLLVEPIGCPNQTTTAHETPPGPAPDCNDYTLVVLPRIGWFRPGEVAAAADGSVTLTPHGFGSTTIKPTRAPVASLSGQWLAAHPPHKLAEDATAELLPLHVAFGLNEPIGLREGDGAAPSLEDVRTKIDAAREAELGRYRTYGALSEVKEALQAATMWNYIYSPAEYGPMLPVSRSWNFVKHAANADWEYVLFDWDNLFASYMASLDPRSRDVRS